MQTTYLSMGSNIGDRQYYLHEAIRLLGKHPKIMIEKVSNFYESTPVGGVKQDDFTNLALKVATLLEPLELLSFIHEVELSLNRERKIHWGPRTIDIDIIFYDDLEMQEENLVIPHKEAFNRLFVLKPIFELIDKDFKYYASIEKAIAELSVSEQELHVIKEEKTPVSRSVRRCPRLSPFVHQSAILQHFKSPLLCIGVTNRKGRANENGRVCHRVYRCTLTPIRP